MDRHDTKRSVNKTEEYFQPESPLFSQTGHDQKSRQHHEEEYFRARTPLKGQVSPEDMLRTQDEAQVNREQPFKDRASPKYLTDHQEYVEKAGAYFSKDGSQRSRLGTDQDFMNMEEPVKGRADHKSKSITEDFINKGDPARGKATDDDQSKSVSEKFFEKSQAQFGKDKYDRSRGDEREFENQSEDITGKSVSGESEVANHQPFNALNDLVVNNPSQSGIPLFNPKPNFKDNFKPMSGYKEEGGTKRKKKTIIYSDKSESSVDEMMADTPSNYNIPNGRLDGKSMGLKAVMMNVKKLGGQQPLSTIQENENKPVALKSGQMFNRGSSYEPGQHQKQRQFVQSLNESKEEWNQSHNVGTVQETPENRRNQGPRVNKTFLEGNPNQDPKRQHMKNNYI